MTERLLSGRKESNQTNKQNKKERGGECGPDPLSTPLDRPMKVRKKAKIRNQYNQAPHLTQDTNGKVTTSQLDITNESQEVDPFQTGDHKASINRRARKHNKTKTKIT